MPHPLQPIAKTHLGVVRGKRVLGLMTWQRTLVSKNSAFAVRLGASPPEEGKSIAMFKAACAAMRELLGKPSKKQKWSVEWPSARCHWYCASAGVTGAMHYIVTITAYR